MSYNDWVFFPNSGFTDPNLSQTITHGLMIGDQYLIQSGASYTRKVVALKKDNPRIKWAYYKDGKSWTNPDVWNFGIALGVESSTNITVYFKFASKRNNASQWTFNGDLNATLSNTYNECKYGSLTQYVNGTLMEGVPVYDSLAAAGAAFADGIWEPKTKYIEGGYTDFGGGGEGSTWGGGGLFDHSSDAIDFSPLPTDYGTATKLFQIYLPTQTELSSFADFLFSTSFDIDNLKKLFAEPMSYILGLSVFPLPISATSQSAHNIYVGNVNTGVQAHLCNKQFIEFDCGSLLVKPFWDAYLDYAPYTKMTLFLPFIGFKDLDTDDIVGKTLHIKYQIDIITGACMAQVKVGDSVRYSFIGQCSANIPLSSQDWTQSIQGAISIAGQIGSMATTGSVSASGISNIASTAVNMVKPNVQRSGGFSGSGAFMGYKTPYLVITRPIQALPEDQANIKGFPSYVNVSLGDCEEFTQVDSWYPEGFTCSKNELDEIDRLLKEGVYL